MTSTPAFLASVRTQGALRARTRWRVSLAFLAALLVLAAQGAAGIGQHRSAGRVVGVTDGDTITVLVGGRQVTVRIDGVDCPEPQQAYGRVARTFTSGRVFGKAVVLEPKDVDQYGRLVARVLVGEMDLGRSLVAEGLAWHYTEYSNDRTYAAAEQAARRGRLGLWADKEPIPPWRFRRDRRARTPPAAPAAPPPPAGPLHGNVESKVFHRPGCPNYNCKQCTAVFATAAEAMANGFKPAGDCHRR